MYSVYDVYVQLLCSQFTALLHITLLDMRLNLVYNIWQVSKKIIILEQGLAWMTWMYIFVGYTLMSKRVINVRIIIYLNLISRVR